MTALILYLFNHPRLHDGDQTLELNSKKGMALLAVLAVEAGQWHSRDQLAALIWPDSDQTHARTNLRRLLYRLSQTAVSGWLEAEPERVALRPRGDDWIDVARFAACYAEATGHEHELVATCARCLEGLRNAIDLYRGDFLADFYLPDSSPFEAWATTTRLRFQRQALHALAILTSAMLVAGKWEEAEQLARRQLEIDDLREAAWRQLMEALARGGQRNAALAEYRALVGLLGDELAVQPVRETTELYEAILAGDLAPEPSTSPTIQTMPQGLPPHNLPVATTPLIGREKEQADLELLLADAGVRLVTIVGPGGMGKTRLALKVALHLAGNLGDGAAFADLTPIQGPEGIVPALAQALQFAFQGRASETRDAKGQLLDYLRGKALLLVLDNFEHLLEGTPLLMEIVQAAPAVKLLVTSRQRLRLQAEHVYPLEGLTFTQWESVADAEGDPAVQLFLYHAQRVRPSFALRRKHLQPLQEIFRLVEGMPLAVILAAAWVEMMSPAQIAMEIGKSLDFLEVAYRDLPKRQWSMRAVFAPTWERLSGREREVFAALSVFRGGFTLEAAWEVAGARPRELRRLLERSLLVRSEGNRFQVHELLRQFAAEQLAQNLSLHHSVRERYWAHYLDKLVKHGRQLGKVNSHESMVIIESDWGNIHFAWNMALEQADFALLGNALESMVFYLDLKGDFFMCQEMLLQLQDKLLSSNVLSSSSVNISLLAWLSFYHGVISARLGKFQDAEASLQVCIAAARALKDNWQEANALGELGEIYWKTGRYDASTEVSQKAIEIFRTAPNRKGEASAHNRLGIVAYFHGQLDIAQKHFLHALHLRESLDDELGVSRVLNNLALVARMSGDLARSIDLHKRSLEINRRWSDQKGVASSLNNLAFVSFLNTEADEALRFLKEALTINQEVGDREGEAVTHLIWGHVNNLQAKYKSSYVHFRTALEMATRISIESKALESIIGIAGHMARHGNVHRSLMLIRFALDHPASNQIVVSHGDPLYANLSAGVSNTTLEEIVAQSKLISLEEVTSSLLIDRLFMTTDDTLDRLTL